LIENSIGFPVRQQQSFVFEHEHGISVAQVLAQIIHLNSVCKVFRYVQALACLPANLVNARDLNFSSDKS
jgi:hypothetical protein